MKLFSKKPESESLKTLNEKEIQERLYGKYHAEHPAKPQAPSPPRVTVAPQIESKFNPPQEDPELSSFFKPKEKFDPSAIFSALFASLKKFPWKSSGLWVASFIAIIFLFQLLSFFKAVRTKPHPEPTKSIEAPSKPSVNVKPVKEVAYVKPKAVTPTPVKAVTPPVETKKPQETPSAPKKKLYAVQVCTYFKESDAKALTEELTTLNFPAYYQSLSSGHFLVFLGKDQSYEDAQAKLEAFKKTKQFETFQDSFIRSL